MADPGQSVPPTDDAAVKHAIAIGFKAAFFFISCYAIVLWEMLTSFNKERKRIWTAPWGIIKTLYCITRYWAVFALSFNLALQVTVMSEDYCHSIVKLTPIFAAFFMWAAAGILALRCLALWQRDSRIAVVLAFLFCAEVGVMIAACTRFVPHDVFLEAQGACMATSPKPHDAVTALYYLGPLAYDLIVTTLTLYKAWQLHQAGLRSRLFHVFVEGQLLYFVALTVVNAISVGFNLQGDRDLQNINNGTSLCFTAIFACRLVLGLRDEAMLASNTPLSGRSFSSFPSGATASMEKKTAYVPRLVSVAKEQTGSLETVSEKPQTPTMSHPFATAAVQTTTTRPPARPGTANSYKEGVSIEVDKAAFTSDMA